MAIFLISFTVMALVVVAMSVGVLMGRKPISGSCGGVGAALGEKNYSCDICGGDESKCEEQRAQDQGTTSLAYDATVEKK
jgi:hypothetical protein